MKGDKRMKIITNFIYSTFAVFTLACFALAQQAPDRVSIRVITTFDYPGTGNSTRPHKINDEGDIVGSVDSNGVTRGFVRFANGNFSAPIVDPNDTCNVTEGSGINNSRLISGNYQNGSDCLYHGYFLMGGNFSEFDVPDSVSTELHGVNNVGDFGGDFTDATGLTQGFVSIGGTITPFSVPGATFTSASGPNSSNQLVGNYIDSSGISHGYWRDSNGALHFPIDPPGSTLTILFGNNDSNSMVGRYMTADGVTHGLFFVPPNRFFTFDYPGSTFTSLNGINRDGFICGHYNDAAGIGHGIIARVRVGAAANEEGTK
jgi:hypothetical protein